MVFVTFANLLASPVYIAHAATISKTMEDESVYSKVVASLLEGLQHPDVDQKLQEDVESLNVAIQQIRSSFAKISGLLFEFDQAGYRDKNGNALKLQSGWDELSSTFDTKIAKSQDDAASAVGFLHSYIAVMTTPVSDNNDIDDLKQALEEFKSMILEEEKKAGDEKESFSDLAKKVQEYKATIQYAVAQAEELLLEEIEDAEEKKQKLNAEAADIEGEMQALLVAIGTSTNVAAGAAIFALVLLSPLAAAIALGFANDALEKKKEYDDLNTQLDGKVQEIQQIDAQLADFNTKLADLERFKASIDDTGNGIDSIVNKIDGIANIWGSLDSDLSRFETVLGILYNMDDKTLYNNALPIAEEMYNKLCSILNLYVNGQWPVN